MQAVFVFWSLVSKNLTLSDKLMFNYAEEKGVHCKYCPETTYILNFVNLIYIQVLDTLLWKYVPQCKCWHITPKGVR